MKISKQLLQRYELGQCSPEEEHIVCQWLDSESWEEEAFDDTHVKDGVGTELWNNIAPHVDQPKEFIVPQRRWQPAQRWLSVAALLILTLGLTWQFYSKNQDDHVELNNTEAGLKWIREDSFDLALRENSFVNNDLRSDNLLLSGGMMLKPKRNLVLHDRENDMSFDFKEGEVYFISRDPDTSRLIILRQSEILFLPPIIQRQLKQQFHIS